jgi:hypothetical protein
MPIIRALAHGESLQRRPGCCRLGVKTRGTRLRLSVCLFGTARWLTAWLRVCDAVPSVPGVLGNVELVAKNDPEARRQHVGIRRRVHHRTQQHAFAQKSASPRNRSASACAAAASSLASRKTHQTKRRAATKAGRSPRHVMKVASAFGKRSSACRD